MQKIRFNRETIIGGYLLLLLTIITLSIIYACFNLGVKDTIVVNASDYIIEELKRSKEKIEEQDLEFNALVKQLQKDHKIIDSIKVTLSTRNNQLIKLKSLIDEKPTVTYTPNQHDSLFTEFIK